MHKKCKQACLYATTSALRNNFYFYSISRPLDKDCWEREAMRGEELQCRPKQHHRTQTWIENVTVLWAYTYDNVQQNNQFQMLRIRHTVTHYITFQFLPLPCTLHAKRNQSSHKIPLLISDAREENTKHSDVFNNIMTRSTKNLIQMSDMTVYTCNHISACFIYSHEFTSTYK